MRAESDDDQYKNILCYCFSEYKVQSFELLIKYAKNIDVNMKVWYDMSLYQFMIVLFTTTE